MTGRAFEPRRHSNTLKALEEDLARWSSEVAILRNEFGVRDYTAAERWSKAGSPSTDHRVLTEDDATFIDEAKLKLKKYRRGALTNQTQ